MIVLVVGPGSTNNTEEIPSAVAGNLSAMDESVIPRLFPSASAKNGQLSDWIVDHNDMDWVIIIPGWNLAHLRLTSNRFHQELWDTQFQPSFLDASSGFWHLDPDIMASPDYSTGMM
jgi:hypothetical protein